jgi:hypothetical protein
MTDTINTGTMLIGEGVPLPESFQFESEPWTSFYMAGEMIRELRKALENEASTGAEATSGDCPKGAERPEDNRRDEEASWRMDDEGVSTNVALTLPDATGFSRIGGRLLLVGSPIF